MNEEDNEISGVPAKSDIGDQNVERLIGQSYRPEPVDPEFVRRLELAMCSVARDVAERRAISGSQVPITRRWAMGWTRVAWWAIAASLFVAVGITVGRHLGRHADGLVNGTAIRGPGHEVTERLFDIEQSEAKVAALAAPIETAPVHADAVVDQLIAQPR